MTISTKTKTDAIITFVGDHGGCCSCKIVEIFDLEYSKYALLQKIDGDEWGALVLMRVRPGENQAHFDGIEDDAEFDLAVTEIGTWSNLLPHETALGRHVF